MKLRWFSAETMAEFNAQYPNRKPDPEKHFAMPWLSDSGNDFGLGDTRTNQKKLDHFLTLQTEVLEEDEHDCFFLVGDWTSGGYLIKYNKQDKLIYYYCKFDVAPPTKLFPHIVTQVEVWRAQTQVGGMARKFLFEFLFPRFGAIQSDRIHTERGKEFWKSILGTAQQLRLGIAVVIQGQIHLKHPDSSLHAFIDEVDTWHKGPEHKQADMEIQFLIFDPKYLEGLQ
jgi:hypothetical protein